MLRMDGQPVDAPVTRSWTAKGTLRQAAPHSIDRVAAMCTFSSATLGLTKVASSPIGPLARSRAFHGIGFDFAATSANDHRESSTVMYATSTAAKRESRNGRVHEASLQTSRVRARAEYSGQRARFCGAPRRARGRGRPSDTERRTRAASCLC